MEGRNNFGCFLYKERIFIIGGNSKTVEMLDPKTDQASVVGITLTHPENCIALYISEETILAFTASAAYEVDLVTKQLVEKQGTGAAVWSQYPPVLWNNQVFVVDTSGERLAFRWFAKSGEAKGREEVREV